MSKALPDFDDSFDQVTVSKESSLHGRLSWQVGWYIFVSFSS